MLSVFSSETSSPCRRLSARHILLSKSWAGIPILSHGVLSPCLSEDSNASRVFESETLPFESQRSEHLSQVRG